MQKSFGTRLREFRGEYMQVELAHEFGVGQSAYSAWELDKKEPSLNTIRAMCKFFKITADELLGITEERPARQASQVSEPELYDMPPHACPRCEEYRADVIYLRGHIDKLTSLLDEKGKAHVRTPPAPNGGVHAHAG